VRAAPRVLVPGAEARRGARRRGGARSGGAMAADRRYVLCEDHATPPSAPLGRLGHLRVFAASLAGKDMLRAAFIWDSPGNWTVALPNPSERLRPFEETVRDISLYEATRMTGLPPEDFEGDQRAPRLARFAKCFGRALQPHLTDVSCRVHDANQSPGFDSAYWPPPRGEPATGRLQLFDNGELRHNFARCGLTNLLPDFAPERLRAAMHVRLFSGPEAEVRFDLCRVRRERRPLSFCTLPLYGLPRMRAQVPGILDGWLAYHMGVLGFSRAEIYDIDGSFEEDLARWRERGFEIGYHSRWPSWLSPELARLSDGFAGCAESLAYAHCLATHRALSRWVLLLHGPDEYLRLGSGTGELGPGHLARLVERLSAMSNHQVGQLTVRSWPFGRGGSPAEEDRGQAGGSEALHRRWGRGSVLAASRMRAERLDGSMHTPLLDPERCTCAGPHSCTAEKGYVHGNASEVDDRILVTHHYVEMLPWDLGRCARLHNGMAPCNLPDDSLLWAGRLLRDWLPEPG